MKPGRTIYLSHRGNDFADGLTAKTAVRTLARAAELTSLAGSCLLIEGGGIYEGQLSYQNVDDLQIGSFGPNAPLIIPGCQNALTLRNCSRVVISRLRLSGEGYRILNHSMGVLAENCSQLLIKNVEVSGFHESGIHLSGCRATRVAGCFAHDNGSVGINTGTFEDRSCENILITGCKVYDNAGDFTNRQNHSGSGITIAGANHTVVEFCEAAGNGWAQRQVNVNGPVGIWCCCGCDDVVFRYNISRRNRTQPGAIDGDGLDIDGEVRNGVMEFNYTYENEGSGYLLCEYWGETSSILWENNSARFNVSLDDDTRVGRYGAINMSNPNDVHFERMFIHDNFFAAHANRHAVYNKNITSTARDMNIISNVLITDGTAAIEDPEQPFINIKLNVALEDEKVRQDLLACAPRLTQPRDILKQPVFKYLQNGTCARMLQTKGARSLFAMPEDDKRPDGAMLLELQLYGPDTDGCDKSGDISLCYDSLYPSVVTRLRGPGSEIFTPLPWWDKEHHYAVRVKARLQSPDVLACLFIRDEHGDEVRTYLNGPVAEYQTWELPFESIDKWKDPSRYIGVRLIEGHGSLLVHSLQFVELPQRANGRIAGNANSNRHDLLQEQRSFGDCYLHEQGLDLMGGASIERSVSCSHGTVRLTIQCKNEHAGAYAYIRTASQYRAASIPLGESAIKIELSVEDELASFGVCQDCFDEGILTVSKIRLE